MGIVGLFIGDLLGLPFGAVSGFIVFSLLGHYFYDKPKEEAEQEAAYKAYFQRRGELLYFMFSLGAKLAKSDGLVNQNEVNHMERLMRHHFHLNAKGRNDAIRIWNKAKASARLFDDYAREFYQAFGRQRHEVLNAMDFLFALAASDGSLHPREEELLLRAAAIFQIGRLQYDRLKGRYFQMPPNRQQNWTPLDPYYAILGANPNDSTEAIKKKFRSLAIQWHPDKLQARGASPDALRHGKEKFQQINEAYEKIMEARKV